MAVALLVALAPAQVKKGQPAPEFTFNRVWGDGVKGFADLAGKVVILEYGHPDLDVCRDSVKRMNELHAKYGKRGLLVIGVADDAEGKIESTFVKGLVAAYPYVKSNDFAKKYKVEFHPSAFCVDANGLVHSLADWWLPEETTIEELLQALPLPPALPADKRYDALRSAWQRCEYAKVAEQITKVGALPSLDAASRDVLAQQQQALDGKRDAALARIAEIAKGPDYGAAAGELERIEKAWAGMPPAAAARTELERFAADAKIKAEVDAARALDKLMTGVDTSKIPLLRKAIADLDRFRKKYAGTLAGKRADQHHTRLAGRPN
jgi:cytochrome c biogenesis protein CcmG/thiol:disulfide interchange protein DsbE